MKQEQVIELAKQAGFPFNKYGLLQGDEEGEIEADEMFTRFASLVEQATLERAANICERIWPSDDRSGHEWSDGFADGTCDCAEAIRDIAKDTK